MEPERIERLDRMIAEGRVLRGMWTDGNERACLLAALSPEAGRLESARACPASVMPAWLAELTPSMDDRGTDEAWPAMVQRYAALARRWRVLDGAAWSRCEARCKLASLAVAREHADARGRAAIATVVALLERRIAGDEPSADEWRAAAKAEASADAAWAAEAAADAAAAAAAAWAAEAAADAAARAAAWAAADAAAKAAAKAAAEEAAKAAWDSINDATLAAVEVECSLAEGGG